VCFCFVFTKGEKKLIKAVTSKLQKNKTKNKKNTDLSHHIQNKAEHSLA